MVDKIKKYYYDMVDKNKKRRAFLSFFSVSVFCRLNDGLTAFKICN